jgi:hypothetical protein
LEESVASHDSAYFFCVGSVVSLENINVETVLFSSRFSFIYNVIERLRIEAVDRVVGAILARIKTWVLALLGLLVEG